MSSSDDLEVLVARFRPVGPPPELRGRVLAADGARGFSRALVEWLPAAAALLLFTLFHFLAGTERQWIESRLAPIPPIELTSPSIEETPR